MDVSNQLYSMRNYFLILLIILTLPELVIAQRWPGYVLAEPSLNLRDNPSSNSNVITSIPYGTYIKVHPDISHITDTVNGVIGKWFPIEFEDQKGYVWGEFITYNKNLILNYGLLLLGQDGSNYNPSLNWYGLYKSKDGFSRLEKVKIDLKEQYNDMYGNRPNRVMIDSEDNPLFLYGTKENLVDGEISGISLKPKFNENWDRADYDRQLDESFLYPEEIKSLSLAGVANNLWIKAKDRPYFDSVNNRINTQYELEVTDTPSKIYNSYFNSSKNNIQTITTDFPINAPASKCVTYKNPIIYWYGDLDMDKKTDLILSFTTMAETEGETTLVLFLSSEAENGNHLKMVAETGGVY
jgi:hypothetical protein